MYKINEQQQLTLASLKRNLTNTLLNIAIILAEEPKKLCSM